MRKIYVIIKREFITRVMTKGFIIGTLLVPVLMVGFIGLQVFIMSQEHETSTLVGVLDKSGIVYDQLYAQMDDTLSNGERKYKMTPITKPDTSVDETAYFANFIREDVFNLVIVIPEDILSSQKATYIAKKVSNYDLIRSISRSINSVLTEYQYKQAGIDVDKINQLRVRIDLETVKVTEKEVKESSAAGEYFTAVVLMLLLYMTLLMYGTYIWKGIVEDKISKIVEILLSSVNSLQFMFGKIFGNAIIGLVQILIWGIFAVVAFVAGISVNPAIGKMISLSPDIIFYFTIFFLLGFFLYSTFFAIVGAISGSMDDAQQLQTPFTILIIIAFLVSMAGINNPDSSYMNIMSYIPFFTPIVMFTRIIVSEPPLLGILFSIAITIVTIVLMTMLAAKIFRVGILMTGKRPNLPEIVRWLKK
ncbi:MAG: ABC transporter permease [Calditrichia bacterium]